MKWIQKRSKFTLVELLVVIAIITILAALLLPALQSAIYQAKIVNCMSNQKQQGVGLTGYCNDNRRYYPFPNAQVGVRPARYADYGGQVFEEHAQVLPYFADKAAMKGVFTCPFVVGECESKWGTSKFPYNGANGVPIQTFQLWYWVQRSRVGNGGGTRVMKKLGQRWQYTGGSAIDKKWFNIVSSDPLITRVYGLGGMDTTWGNAVTHIPQGAPLVDPPFAVFHGMGMRVSFWAEGYNSNYLFSDGSVKHHRELVPGVTLGGSWMWKAPTDYARDTP